ncbi:MAG: ferrochelatase [Rhodobiaceae bacterium]|nr:ferrochelatase [Rhodobiaceae bacterium]
MSEPRKIAVVLLNLGGPDGPDAVKPFLFNLFSDPAIIQLPNPFRWLVAKIISSRRAPVARQIYAQIGGKSPIVAETQRQADALEEALRDLGEVRCFLAMRYWHPLSSETAVSVAGFAPDMIVLLPLYPQFSTTTTGSSLKDWFKVWGKQVGPGHTTKKTPEYREIFGYPVAAGWIDAQVELIRASLQTAGEGGKTRLLFSAHGLPKKIIDGGDPYQTQIEQSCAAVVEKLGVSDLDWVTCYQSRVGPMERIGPSTEQEIERAGRDGKKVVIVPIAFVSDHSETLVELDIEYKELSERVGVPAYVRVPTVGTHPAFIGALSQLVRDVL